MRRADVVVQLVAHVGDLARRAPAFGDDRSKNARTASRLPTVGGADEVGRQVQCAEQALGSCGLVAGDPDQEAELPELLQAGASVRVQVVLIEVLREVGLLRPEPLDRQIKPRPKLLEGLAAVPSSPRESRG
jgi:hypothetical protein